MIEIYKASAGSGKTFMLTKKYITMMLVSRDPYAYRHILAVTFTNKATEEMKSRILRELDVLAREPERSHYIADLRVEIGDDVEIRKRSETLLFNLLHDYSAFSVSTIDSFFQLTLRSFAREMGQFSNYQVELDRASLRREAVDRVLDSLTEKDRDLIEWMSAAMLQNLEDGKKARVEEALLKASEDVLSEKHRDALEKSSLDESQIYSRERVDRIREECVDCRKRYLEKLKSAAQACLKILEDAGVSPEDTFRKFAAVLDRFTVPFKEIPSLNTTFRDKAVNSSEWFSKKNAGLLSRLDVPALEKAFSDFLELYDGDDRICFNTASMILERVDYLGVAGEITREYAELSKEKNVLDLDNSNTLLSRLIGDCDAPFVYEKMGVRYDHFLLDEFQDTSAVQWSNLSPLVRESLGRGEDDLIVGDVKQSIYRFRGSDWSLLAEGVKAQLEGCGRGVCREVTLEDNWRSLANIVNFNNAFFRYAADYLDRELPGGGNQVSEIYSTASQNVRCGKEGEGRVAVSICGHSSQLGMVYDSVARLRDEYGVPYAQIAVLARVGADAADIAKYLIDKGIPVISDDALQVKSSPLVGKVAQLLRYVDNPSDEMGGYLARTLGLELPDHYRSIPDLAETLVRAILERDPEAAEGNIPYLMAFLDCIQEWSARNGNHLRGFLEYWDDAVPVLSSPSLSDAVRVMTIHKSKGLEFPYVIVPFVNRVEYSKNEMAWCVKDLSGTPFPSASEMPLSIDLTKSAADSMYAGEFRENRLLQTVDGLNMLYVAMTRAGRSLELITTGGKQGNMAPLLAGFCLQNKDLFDVECFQDPDNPDEEIVCYSMGDMPLPETDSSGKGGTVLVPMEYRSYPLEQQQEDPSEDVRVRGRLKFSSDAVDFFTGEDAQRRRGIILHDILSDIVLPSDVDAAVRSRLDDGTIDAPQAAEYRSLIKDRIASVRERGWFPDDRSKVRTEVTIADADGRLHRPDRVVEEGGRIIIIDYKTGEESESYLCQLRRYARLYRDMGYADVQACLWYVYENKIVYL